MPGPGKPTWSQSGGVARTTSAAVAEVVTPQPKARLEQSIAQHDTEITRINARIVELQAKVTTLTADKTAMETVLAGVTGDP
jgi:hypothetical protein